VAESKFSPFRNPLCLAVDVDTREQALGLVSDLKDLVGGFKLGPRMIHRYGSEIVGEIARSSPVFVDCKFFDIPSTMLAAVQATFDAGASVCTVHAMAGGEALKALAELERKLNQQRPFRILAVTILTSWDEQSFPSIFKTQPISQHVQQLARLVATSGLRSVVCSPEEITLLAPEKLFLLTPGIRLPTDEAGDQKRIMGPKEALALGSSCLVVGRPIVAAAKPREVAQHFLSLMS
jgi:orotidine-5'-phosphate decarboxylase